MYLLLFLLDFVPDCPVVYDVGVFRTSFSFVRPTKQIRP